MSFRTQIYLFNFAVQNKFVCKWLIPIDADTLTVLKNLRLISDDGKLKYAALLLFSKEPQLYFPSVQFKIGRFGNSASDLMFDDIVEGNILEMVDKVMRLLASKYLISPISYEGIHRIERLEIPEDALRELLCNAIVHKDYQSNTIQMKVYNDRIVLWNPGVLPEDLSLEKLFAEHHSHARNRNIAYTFHRAGLIEAWGRGIEKICKELSAASMPAPKFEQTEGGMCVTIMRNTALQTDTTDTVTPLVTPLVQSLLDILVDKELSRNQIMSALGLKDKNHFQEAYLTPALQAGLIEPTEKPNHPRQKYRRKK